MNRISVIVIALSCAHAPLVACSGDSCGTSGLTNRCVCSTGATGSQTCQPDGAWSTCACSETADSDAGEDPTLSDADEDRFDAESDASGDDERELSDTEFLDLDDIETEPDAWCESDFDAALDSDGDVDAPLCVPPGMVSLMAYLGPCAVVYPERIVDEESALALVDWSNAEEYPDLCEQVWHYKADWTTPRDRHVYEYNEDGDLVEFRFYMGDRLSTTTTIQYNDSGLISRIDSGGPEEFVYSYEAGRLIRETRADGAYRELQYPVESSPCPRGESTGLSNVAFYRPFVWCPSRVDAYGPTWHAWSIINTYDEDDGYLNRREQDTDADGTIDMDERIFYDDLYRLTRKETYSPPGSLHGVYTADYDDLNQLSTHSQTDVFGTEYSRWVDRVDVAGNPWVRESYSLVDGEWKLQTCVLTKYDCWGTD